MVAQGYEKVKEKLCAAVEHLQLHGTAAFEGAAGANDESQVVSPKLGVVVGRVGVRISCRRKNSGTLNSRLYSNV